MARTPHPPPYRDPPCDPPSPRRCPSGEDIERSYRGACSISASASATARSVLTLVIHEAREVILWFG
ncbi:MAG: hypothetical protein QOJ19_163 [Acidimicrobiia bacterium]|jgi:hypothetical protein|nr:hypothetical protein [Acidimicrobiia bacterium]